MFTYNTKDRMRKANCYYSVELEGMENVHLRGAMFGYYKSGSDKERDENDRWPDDGLMLMKPGKLLKKMAEAIETDVTDLDIENAVNRLKNVISIYGDEHGEGGELPMLCIVKGELIGAYYLEDNYLEGIGNLGSSCMRYESCLPAFRIYEDNQDAISMLVLKSHTNKVIARALLWKLNAEYYMDTVYSIKDNYRDMLIDYAKRHDFFYKSQQSCHHNVFDRKGDEHITPFIISVPINFDTSWKVPYMDTMFFAVKRDDQWYATNCAVESDTEIYRMRSTGGRAETRWYPAENYLLHMEVSFSLLHKTFVSDAAKKWIDDNDIRDIPNSVMKDVIKDDESGNYDYKRYFLFEEEEEEEEDENRVYCEYLGEHRDYDDCTYIDRGERRDEYVLSEDAAEVRGCYWWTGDSDIVWVDSEGEYYHVDDTFFCEYNQEHYQIDDAVYVEDYGDVRKYDVEEVAVSIDGTWYNKDNCVQCEISEEWMIEGDEQELPDGRLVTQDEYDKFMAENQEEEEEERP
jgi:hypothetical protein